MTAPPATPVRGGGGEGSSNASRAATRDHSLAAPEAEPSAAEALAMRFHETYERLAPAYGYETREASAKLWADVPLNNKRLMVAVCDLILTVPQWRPIETAPKDGTSFLTVVDDEVRVAAWGKTSHVPIYGFCLADQGVEDFDICTISVWMPLPEPPR